MTAADHWRTGRVRVIEHCDDSKADKLEAAGWTVERHAHPADTAHGAYQPHIAWRWENA